MVFTPLLASTTVGTLDPRSVTGVWGGVFTSGVIRQHRPAKKAGNLTEHHVRIRDGVPQLRGSKIEH